MPTGLLAGIVVFALLPESFTVKLVVASLAAIGGAVLYPLLYQKTLRRRLRKYCLEQLGTEEPFPVEVELSPEGVCTRQKTAQIIFEWPNVEAIQETSDSIDILTRHGGIVVVRKRAFESPEAMRRFTEEAQHYLAESKNSLGTATSS